MSRIGRLPINIPAGVTVTVNDTIVTVKGPKGTLTQNVNENITVTLVKQDNQFNSMTGLLYVYDNYRATFQLSVAENSISILVKDIAGWPVSNICILNIVGVKITNQN